MAKSNYSTFQDFAWLHRSAVQTALEHQLEQSKPYFVHQPANKQLFQRLEDLLLRGGKRLRPNLALLCFELAGGTHSAESYQAVASLEVLHSFMLVHDDIEDGDTLRHGRPTIEGYYRKYLHVVDPDKRQQVALSLAINAGDILHSMVYAQLATLSVDPAIIQALTGLVARASIQTANGQHQDILSAYQKQFSRAKLDYTIQNKTARYSFELPMQFGCLLAGQPRLLPPCSDIALPLGMAFQIVDDILGVFGSTRQIGKSNLSDLREGKKTLLYFFANKLGSTTQKRTLQTLWGKSNTSVADLKQVRRIFDSSGAHAKVEVVAHDQLQKSLRAIDRLPVKEQYKVVLVDFATHCVRRSL